MKSHLTIRHFFVFTILVATLFLFSIVVRNGEGTSSPLRTNEQMCTDNQGKWVSQFNECERISEPICLENGGTYNGCAKSCRHDTEMKVCTRECVQLCTL